MKKKTVLILTILLLAIFLLVKFFFAPSQQKETPLRVVSTLPNNNAVFVNQKAEIIITLNRNITLEEGGHLKVQISPAKKIQTVYQENKIRISPETSFQLNTDYRIEILFKEKLIYTLNFWTNPFTQEQIEEEGAKQTAGDLAFGEAYKEFLQKNPWYVRIPIENTSYRIIYDFEKQSFRIRLKIPPINKEQEKTLIERALSDLKKIGVKEPINYYVLQP